MVVVLCFLILQWSRADARRQRRLDRALQLPGSRQSREHDAYNQMLAGLANRQDPPDAGGATTRRSR